MKIRALQSDRYVIGVRSGDTIKKLFLIIPENDGSLYVNFPYSQFACGRVGIFTSSANAESTIVGDDFPVTTQYVKYSHHPNGTVALSQKGRVRPICKSGVPFGEISGHIFTATFQGIDRYEPIYTTEAAKRRHRIFAAFSPIGNKPAAYKFIAHINSEQELVERSVNGGRGPWLTYITPSGKPLVGVILTTKFPFSGTPRFLLLSVEPVDKVCRTASEFLVFIGGFDPPEIVLNPSRDTRAVMFIYPENDYTEAVRLAGTVDLPVSRAKKSRP